MIRMEDARLAQAPHVPSLHGGGAPLRRRILDGKPVTLRPHRLCLGRVLVYGPLKNVLGLSRVRVAYTAGAAIGPDLFRFYRSIGVNLKQFYGSTETCAYICLQPDGHDQVRQRRPARARRRGASWPTTAKYWCVANLMDCYYKRPDATAEAIDANGYFHTGDAGVFDQDGHLKIIDRAADVGKMNRGAMFAPNYIENKLKFFPFIKEAVAFGNGATMVCAFVNIDMEAVGNWAERRGIAYSGYTDLAAQPQVRELIRDCVEKVNADLASEALMGETQIHRFLVLHKELDPDDDELTRTRKVRRKFIAEKYAVLIEALYSGKPSQFIETQVKFEDGRTGMVSPTCRSDTKTFPVVAQQAA
jgi:long-chain acyl-CoA synthetase